MSGSEPAATDRRRRLLDWLDVLAKLVGAFAVLGVAIFANSLQSRLTGISIQSQREQADTQLRANMFNSLIGPIVGPQKDGTPVSAAREELLAELLALNFHESFELKPLMEDASRRLVEEARTTPSRPAGGPDVRESLWSISRRTSERQKAAIAREWEASRAGSGRDGSGNGFISSLFRNRTPVRKGCEFYTVSVDARSERHLEPVQPNAACQVAAAFRDAVDLRSPDGNYVLRLWAAGADWQDQTVRINVLPFRTEQESPAPTDTTYPFTLTWFELPFTDNTLLPDGNRFAVYLRLHEPAFQKVTMAVMWFPVGYFTPRERPLNYREVQELLGRRAP
ncbi:MAG: hypothetical protein ACM3JH_12225 [Acidithiobacillales bacterium]